MPVRIPGRWSSHGPGCLGGDGVWGPLWLCDLWPEWPFHWGPAHWPGGSPSGIVRYYGTIPPPVCHTSELMAYTVCLLSYHCPDFVVQFQPPTKWTSNTESNLKVVYFIDMKIYFPLSTALACLKIHCYSWQLSTSILENHILIGRLAVVLIGSFIIHVDPWPSFHTAFLCRAAGQDHSLSWK